MPTQPALGFVKVVSAWTSAVIRNYPLAVPEYGQLVRALNNLRPAHHLCSDLQSTSQADWGHAVVTENLVQLSRHLRSFMLRAGINRPSLVSGKVGAASEDELRNIITNGKGHMPKYKGKLTSDEIDTLVQQIKALNKK